MIVIFQILAWYHHGAACLLPAKENFQVKKRKPQKKERKLQEFCAEDGPGKWRMSVVVVVVVEGYSTVAVGGRRGWWDSDYNCETVGTHLTRRTSDTHGGGTRTRRTNRPTVWTARRDRDRGFWGLSGRDWGDKPWRGPEGAFRCAIFHRVGIIIGT